MPGPRILLPILLLFLIAATAAARVDYEPISDEESGQLLQQIDRGETPAATVLVRALRSNSTKLRARAAELLGHVEVGSIDEWYALHPLLERLYHDNDSLSEGATYPDPGMATVRWWVHASLQRISGQDFGYRWDAPLSDRHVAFNQWFYWGMQRSLALLQAHPDFELPPTESKERFLEILRSEPGNDITWFAAFWERAWYSTVWEMGALGAVFLAAMLLVGAPWIVSDRRRAILLGVAIATLGLSGYAYYDREYLVALLRMRDVQAVREDCARLLKFSRTSDGFMMLTPGNAGFPMSFQALRIVQVGAGDYTVNLEWDEGSGSRPYYWYLYDPEGLQASVPKTFNRPRPTFWKGMYLFHPSLH